MTNWTALYAKSRPHLVAAGFFQLGSAGFVLLVVLIVASILYFGLDEGFAALFFSALVLCWCAWQAGKGWHDYRGDPLVVNGTITDKVIKRGGRTSSGKSSHKYYFYMDVDKAFVVSHDGSHSDFAKLDKLKKLSTHPALYERLQVGEPVVFVCTPSRKAFAVVTDLVDESETAIY